MAKPIFHAISSAKRYGGTPDDYLAMHEFLDSSKGSIADNRHRALTHNLWFVKTALQRVFGDYLVIPTTDHGKSIQAQIDTLEEQIGVLREQMRTEKAGRVVSVAQIGEDHILEDYGNKFIPTVQDYLYDLPFKTWLNNGERGHPPSYQGIADSRKVVKLTLD